VTAVVAIESDGRVYMAGDSAFSNDNEMCVQRDPKLFKRGDTVLIGICGAARFEALMRYAVKIPRLKSGDDLGEWVNMELAYEIRQAHIRDGFVNDSGPFELADSEAMIGVAGQLFVLEQDLGAWRPLCGYAAIGSGAGPARTSLRETADRKFTPRSRLKRALERATAETTGVRPPFHFEAL
jgi:ATP-dependent protease HslVU (ClpYQ) peptidase subunit